MSVSRSNNTSASENSLFREFKGEEFCASFNSHSIDLLEMLFVSSIDDAIVFNDTDHLPTLEILIKLYPLNSRDIKFLNLLVDYVSSDNCQFEIKFYCRRYDKVAIAQAVPMPEASALIIEMIALSKVSAPTSDTKLAFTQKLITALKQHQKKIIINEIDTVINWISFKLNDGYFPIAITALALTYQCIQEGGINQQYSKKVDSILKSYMMKFIENRTLNMASDIIGEKVINRILVEMCEQSKSNPNEDDDENDIKYALLEAYRADFPDDIELLKNLKFDFNKTDSNWYTALHFCKTFDLLPDALAFTTKELINKKNLSGKTALHVAALNNDIKKIKFLIQNGADPNIKDPKGKTFWMIQPPSRKEALKKSKELYDEFTKNGKALRYEFPKKQKGGCCGLNAVELCYRLVHESSTLENSTVVVRASDIYQSNPSQKTFIPNPFSLRKFAKKKGLTIDGAMSANGLSVVLKEIGCEGRIIETLDEAHFITTIKSAIDLRLPIIVSFCTGENDIPVQADETAKGHWATIVSYTPNAQKTTIETVLVAQFEGHYKMNIHELFLSHFNPAKQTKADALSSEKEYWGKSVVNKRWMRFTSKPKEKTVTKFYETNIGRVEGIHKKLIVVSLFKSEQNHEQVKQDCNIRMKS